MSSPPRSGQPLSAHSADTHSSETPRATPLAWAAFGLGAISFSQSYFHRVSPSAMVSDLMRDFAVGAAAIGNLSAFYLYSYMVMQLPVGMMADRFGERRVLAAGALVCAVGSAVFAGADSMTMAYLGRLLIGVGAACALVPAMQIAGHWFPPHRFAVLSGLTVTIGMAGGVIGQGPLAAMVAVSGWRPALLASAVFALALAAVIWFVVCDRPPSAHWTAVGNARPRPAEPLFAGLGRAFANGQTWLLCVSGSAVCCTLLAFGVLWATPYMTIAYDLSRSEAAATASMILFGWGIGAPIQGWLSDYVRRRRTLLVIANFGVLVSFAGAVYLPDLPLLVVRALFLANGFFSGAMVCAFAAAREHNPDSQGAATAVVNTAIIGTGAAMQPAIGWILDLRWDGRIEAGARIYSAADYRVAFLVLVAGALAGMIAAIALRETYAKPISQRLGE